MFSRSTPNYHLPQWNGSDKPTWLGDMNEAFTNIDTNLKAIELKAEEGGVPQSIIDRIVALEENVAQVITKIGTDVIDTIGTSITNAIVNLKSAIDTITTKIGNTNISDVGDSITSAIRYLKDSGGGVVPQSIIDRIVALEENVTQITTKIGTDVIDTIGTSITNAIVNLKSAIDSATENIATNANHISQIFAKIGDVDISTIGQSITRAISNLDMFINDHSQEIAEMQNLIGNTDISEIGNTITSAIDNLKNGADEWSGVYPTNKQYNGKRVYVNRVLIDTDNTMVRPPAEGKQTLNLQISTEGIEDVVGINVNSYRKQVYIEGGSTPVITKPTVISYYFLNSQVGYDLFNLTLVDYHLSGLNDKETGRLMLEIEFTKNETEP